MNRPNPQPTSRESFAAFVAAATLGALLFGCIDLVNGFLLDSREATFFDGIRAATITLANVASGGLVVGVALALSAIVGRLTKFRLLGGSALFWAIAAVLSAGFLAIHVDTLSGPRVRGHRFFPAILWGVRIGGPVSIVLGAAILRALARRVEGRAIATTVLCLASVACGAALQVANTKILVGLYPGFHLQLAAMSAIACGFAVFVAIGRGSKVAIAVTAGTLALSIGAWSIRRAPDVRSVLTLAMNVGPTSAELTRHQEAAFRLLVPLPQTALRISGTPGSSDYPVKRDAEKAKELERRLADALPNRKSMNVLLVAMDTVRADHVGFNGYERKTTPRLDELAASSWVFPRAYAPYPTSNYTYSAFFTALLPRATPAYGFANDLDWKFPADFSMPARFRAEGWNTVGVSAFGREMAVDPKFFGSLSDGFDVYNPEQTEANADGAHITDSLIKALASKKSRPFFAWAHYVDPHDLYEKRAEFDFGDGDVDRYDSEIAYTDHQIGRLFDALKKAGEFDNTIIVVFSDHGEEFREHGKRFHNSSVYEQQIHVPLLIKAPGLTGRRVGATVSLVDVLPTLYDLVGFEDAHVRHGRTLLPMMLAEKDDEEGYAYSELFVRFGGQLAANPRAVIRGSKKLIWHRTKDVFEAYDVVADPLERRNFSGRDDETEARLRALLEAIDALIDSKRDAAPAAADPKARFEERVEAAIVALMDTDPKAGNAALNQFNRLLNEYTGEPAPDTLRYLGEAGLDRLSRRLEEFSRDRLVARDVAVARRLALATCLLRRPASAGFFAAQVAKLDSASLPAAVALARIGDRAGLDLLGVALETGKADLRQVAVGLAHLGDPRALPWVWPVLTMRGGWEYVAAMIDALPKISPPGDITPYIVRDFAAETGWKPPPLQRHLVRAFAAWPKSDATTWALARFSLSEDPMVAAAATAALAAAGFDEERMKLARPALEAELDGDKAVLDFKADLGYALHAQALAACRPLGGYMGENPCLVLRHARNLQLDGKNEEARALLISIRDSKYASEWDKAVAARRLATLTHPPRIKDPAAFGVRIDELKIPAEVDVDTGFPVTFKATNTGSVAWQGGFWNFASSFQLRWRDDGGKLLPASFFQPRTYVPPGGVLPGETIEFTLLGASPPRHRGSAKPIVIFEQPWLTLPNDGEVAAGATPTKIK